MKVIFDCDNTMGIPRKEVDDGLTLLYLLGRSDVELLGVTTTFGNGSADAAYTQTVRLLHDVGRADIPVYRGADRRGAPPTAAARFLAEMAAAYPGEISLLATGPLGNLRAAAELDLEFIGNVQRIACMGGYLHPLRIGYRTFPELNLSGDPEGSWLILNAPSRDCSVTLMNAHVCLQAPFRWRDLRSVRHWGSPVRKILRTWLVAFGWLYCGVPEFYLWDLLPAVYLSYPALFRENLVRMQSTVEDLESGTLKPVEVTDGPAVNMPAKILDPKHFKAILMEAWAKVSFGSYTFVG
ncbi:MAG: nucleoside hydrolase [Anaerolineae bacterium]|nr:nucleoside hydrolase [Anaerolineae bacterium]